MFPERSLNCISKKAIAFKTGQILARIDPEAFQSAVERGEASVNNSKAQLANAKAGIESSNAQIEQIKAQLENARSIHQRNDKLHEEGIISEADFEASLSNVRSLEANLKASEANKRSSDEMSTAARFSVKSAQASLKELRTSLKRTTIFAPNDGIVSSLSVEQGERVVGTIQMAGTEMMRIADMRSMEVQVDISENDVLRVQAGDEVNIEVDAYLDKTFKGRVTQIANSANNISSQMLNSDQVTNFVVKIHIEPSSYIQMATAQNPYPFRPGMSATVDIYTNKREDVLCVPIQAVTTRDINKDKEKGNKEEDEREVVFVVDQDTIQLVVVETGIQDDSYIEITKGLSEASEVVAGPYSAIARKLNEGDVVRVVDKDKFFNADKKK